MLLQRVVIISGLSWITSALYVIDLTHSLGPSTIYWPGNPDYNFTILSRGQQPNFWYESNYFATAEHGGTHLDAPAHFANGGWRTQQIPMEKLIGPGVIIDVETKAAQNPDYRVTVGDVKDWESKYGKIPNGAIVLMHSGWSYKYPNRSEIFMTSTPDDPNSFHFPGWHEDTTRWLVDNRNIHVVGVDTPSVDYGQSKLFPTHVILGSNNIPAAENVAHLQRLPPNGTMVFVAVVKLQDGSGGPARVFAMVNEEMKKEVIPNAGESVMNLSSVAILIFSLCIVHCISV